MTASERREMRRKIIKGGKIADQIRQQSKHHHTTQEVPHAEQEIERQLRAVDADNEQRVSDHDDTHVATPTLTWWQRTVQFLKHLLVP